MILIPSIPAEGYPEVLPPANLDTTVSQTEILEPNPDPLVFIWDEDEFIAAEAVRSFSAEMYADS